MWWATCHEHLRAGAEDGGGDAVAELGEQLEERMHVLRAEAM